MAYTKKTTTKSVETKAPEVTTKETVEKKVEEVKVTEKQFQPEDTVLCRSIVNGGLYIEGTRSHILYTWADYGDVMDVEYRDLIYMVRTRADKNIYEPRIIIEDADFVNQNASLKEFYDSMYTTTDFYDILSMPPAQMKKVIETLPIGAKNAIKGIAATMIDDHRLDSVNKIKALDEIFGTNLILTLVQE